MDTKEIELLAAQVATLNRIAAAIEAIAGTIAPAPNITRPMADWAKAADILESLGATVTAQDKSGPTRAEYQGRVYVRRNAHDEDEEKSDAIWFSCVLSGSVKDSNVKWARLVTFRDRKTDSLPNGAKKLKVEAPATAPAQTKPAPAPIVKPAVAAAAPIQAMPAAAPAKLSTYPTPIPAVVANTPVDELVAHFGPNPRQAKAPAPAPDANAARAEFYRIASEAIHSGKLTAQAINEMVKVANGGGFEKALEMIRAETK